MLIEFKVTNYRSIRAEQTLSMVASNYSDELPQNLISCDHVPGLKGTKLVKAVALYGANASGKSNIVAALRFFAEFVRDSATKLQPDAPTGAQPFKLDPACLTEPSKFEITAVINGIRTLYGLELTRERVTSEYLVAYPKGRPQVWFERDWDEASKKYDWSKSTVHFKHDDSLHEKTRGNAAFLAVAAQFNVESAKPSVAWFARVTAAFLAESKTHLGLASRAVLSIQGAREGISTSLLRADTGVSEIRVTDPEVLDVFATVYRDQYRNLSTNQLEEMIGKITAEQQQEVKSDLEDSKNFFSKIELVHRGALGTFVALDFENEESVGTRRFLDVTAQLYTASTMGFLQVFDELESSLHPVLISEALKSFQAPDGSAAGGQLLFTTHNPLLLDQTLLRRDQIWFTEKDQEGATRLYPLTDFKPRKDESLVKGYLAGRYGGIPFIPEGLKY